jgi:hypothetical protein
VDFLDMMTHGGATPGKHTLSMGWFPESGYIPWQWDSYSEHLLLLILGLGHPTRPLPQDSWDAWGRMTTTLPSGDPLVGANESLFIHQYSHLFIDFRRWRDGPLDYFRNSRLATLRDRSLCATDGRYATYRAGFWGRSASGSLQGYRAFSPVYHDGTVCLGCAGASAPFAPALVLGDLRRWATGPYRARIWGRYGFGDSLNLDGNWFDPDALGITVGALYLALTNLDGRREIWPLFESIPAVRRGLRRTMGPRQGQISPALLPLNRPAPRGRPASPGYGAFGGAGVSEPDSGSVARVPPPRERLGAGTRTRAFGALRIPAN